MIVNVPVEPGTRDPRIRRRHGQKITILSPSRGSGLVDRQIRIKTRYDPGLQRSAPQVDIAAGRVRQRGRRLVDLVNQIIRSAVAYAPLVPVSWDRLNRSCLQADCIMKRLAGDQGPIVIDQSGAE